MPKISYTGKQYTVTIPKELMELMNWEKGTKIYIGKDQKTNSIFIEAIPERNEKKKEERKELRIKRRKKFRRGEKDD